jgi:parallel beta-helix repeat protein/predicted outer membrane repeat protein
MKTWKTLLNALLMVIIILSCQSQVGASAQTFSSEAKNILLYVKPGASGDCSSWAAACELQTALAAAAAGDSIWVAAGTYKPTSTIDRTISFSLKSGVAIYGGFPAAGGDWETRDWLSHITTLSGDIDNSGTIDNNTYQIVRAVDVDATATLDGFTITGGNAWGNDDFTFHGGGVGNYTSSPRYANLLITNSTSWGGGGGMYNQDSNPSLVDVTFTGNNSITGGGMYNKNSHPSLLGVDFATNGGGGGGGMFNDHSNPLLESVTFTNHTVSGSGAGLENSFSNPTLKDVTFTGNLAGSSGGGIYNTNSSPRLINVTISNNTANDNGGGMYNGYSSNPILTNVTISNNQAKNGMTTGYGGGGGGIYNFTNSNPILNNVSLIGNSALNRGGGMYSHISTPILTGVNFISNTAGKMGGGMYNYCDYDHQSEPALTRVIFSANRVTGGDGGGMYNDDWCKPKLLDVIFSGNYVDLDQKHGGGMFNDQATTPTITNVTFVNNWADTNGGGIYNTANAISLTNVTFSGNYSTGGYGGGMYSNYGTASLNQVTFHQNNVPSFGKGAGMYITNTTTVVTNSIFWENYKLGDTDTELNQITADQTTPAVTYSLIQGGWGGTGNLDQDPLLGALADNGGFTQTHALGAGSPAIDAASLNVCPATDQRGFWRPIDGDGNGAALCDMGAYEYGSQLPFYAYLPILMR